MHKEHTTPSAPVGAGAPPLIRPATPLQQWAWQLLHTTVLDTSTGELRAPTLKQVRQCAADAWPAAPPIAVKAAWTWATWELDRFQVRTQGDADLCATIAGRQRALTRNIGKPREGYHRTRLQIADDERRRRRLSLPTRTPAPRPQRPARSPAAPVARAGVFPVTTPAAAQLTLESAPLPPPTFDVVAMIARLHARNAARLGTQEGQRCC